MNKFLSIFFLIAAIFQTVKFTRGTKKEKEDILLGKVERWIRYSIDTGYVDIHKQFESFLPPEIINSQFQFLHDFMEGKCFVPMTTNTPDQLDMDIPNSVLELVDNRFIADIAYSFNALHPANYAFGHWEQAKRKMQEIFENSDNQRPNWMITLLKIGDLFGWQHFWTFKTVLKFAYFTSRGISFPVKAHARLYKYEPFCAKAGINIANIMKMLKELAHKELAGTIVLIIELGEKSLDELVYRGMRWNAIIFYILFFIISLAFVPS